MKKQNILGTLGIVMIITFCSFLVSCMYNETEQIEDELVIIENTSLCVINNSKDTTIVYLTLGSIGDTNYVQSTLGIFGIDTSAVQGSFTLLPNDTLIYMSPIGKGFNGNLSFGTPPINCPDTVHYPKGINIFEFTLNNNFDINSQETIDISCVSGVNCYIVLSMIGGGLWNDGKDTLSFFGNNDLHKNTGLSGVFPFGCDSCVGITLHTPYCVGHKPYATPQKTKICNVQRNYTANGGIVLVRFSGYSNNLTNK